MRFARHLAAVLLTVAAIVALGMAWAHASGGGAAGPDRRPSTARVMTPGQQARARQSRAIRVRHDGGGPGLNLSDSGELTRTFLVEAVVMAVVITPSAARRHRRRARRAAA